MTDGSGSTALLASPDRTVAGLSRALLVVNPGSRGGRAALPDVLRAFAAAGVDVQVAETNGPSHATTLVRERIAADAEPFDAVFTLGGDGTAMEVATGLGELSGAPPLGILAVGTANVLARSLGIPMSPARAVPALLQANTVSIDLGRIVGGPCFAIGLGVGLDVAMIGGASAMLKRRIGYLAYGWAAIRAGLRMERFGATITVDGVSQRVETSSILVANFGLVLADLVCFGEDIVHHDGLLHVCVYSPNSLFDAARILRRMILGGVSADRCVRTIPGRHIRIETDVPRPIQADGELLGLTPVEVEVIPAAVRLLVPTAPPRRFRLRRVMTASTAHSTVGL